MCRTRVCRKRVCRKRVPHSPGNFSLLICMSYIKPLLIGISYVSHMYVSEPWLSGRKRLSFVMCIAVCFCVLLWDAVCCSVLQYWRQRLSFVMCIAVCFCVLLWDAVCCSVLQCVAVLEKETLFRNVCCSVLQYWRKRPLLPKVCCSALKCGAVC